MTICTLTNEELEARARLHRAQARQEVAYHYEKNGSEKNTHFSEVQNQLAEVYEELLYWRRKDEASSKSQIS